YRLPRDLDAKVRSALKDWADGGKVGRLWARDPTLWTGRDEARWLGWLGIVDQALGRLDELRRAAEDVRQASFSHVVLLGMGGSSLCPEVLKMTFGRIASWPELHVLDSTDPAQVRTLETTVDLARTLFIVRSEERRVGNGGSSRWSG